MNLLKGRACLSSNLRDDIKLISNCLNQLTWSTGSVLDFHYSIFSFGVRFINFCKMVVMQDFILTCDCLIIICEIFF